jgi:hypothetical protein
VVLVEIPMFLNEGDSIPTRYPLGAISNFPVLCQQKTVFRWAEKIEAAQPRQLGRGSDLADRRRASKLAFCRRELDED